MRELSNEELKTVSGGVNPGAFSVGPGSVPVVGGPGIVGSYSGGGWSFSGGVGLSGRSAGIQISYVWK